MTKILVLEDEPSIRSFIMVNLKRNNFEIVETASGEEALEKLDSSVDIALLDVMLPGISGFEVCKRAREQYPALGIIMLTAKGQEENKIELARRLHTVEKPVAEVVGNQIVTGKFTILPDERKLLKDGVEIELTPIEFALVKYFMENANKAVHRDEILNNVWGYNYVGDFKIVDVNIRRIRQKIEDDPSNPKYIEKVWGYGYRWWGGGE